MVRRNTQRLQNVVAHGKFFNGVFRQRYANCIADAFREKRSNSCRAFDARVLAASRFRYTQMQGVVHAQLGHAPRNQPVRLNHNLNAAGLERDHDVAEIVAFANLDVFNRGLYHAFGRIAVHHGQTFGQTAMIDADPHGDVALLAGPYHRKEFLFNGRLLLLPLR